MAKGVHYFADGTPYSGETHKMPDGAIHTGATHSEASKRVYHRKDVASAKGGNMPKGQYATKPSTVYSDNPKMNTAEMPEPEGVDTVMVVGMGYAMGGMVGGDPTMPVRNQLTARAKMREAMMQDSEDG